MYGYCANNPVRYTDPDGREEYDSSITKEQFDKIQFNLPFCKHHDDSFFDCTTWEDVQDFFRENPNGCIYRNPDEVSYGFYPDKEDVRQYNMYTTDMVDLLITGKTLFSIGKVIVSGVEKGILGKISIHGAARIAGQGATRNIINLRTAV